MKRHIILITATLAMVSVFGSSAVAEQVLMIVKENSTQLELMLTKEVHVMKEMLEQAGVDVVVASASAKPMEAETATLKPDLKLEDVKTTDYAGFIIPCMAAGFDPVPETPLTVAIVKEALAQGKPVAAQLTSVLILAESGVLSGKKYAFMAEDRAMEFPVLEGALYSGTGIVQDGKIIASGICPDGVRVWGAKVKDGTPELTKALIAELSREK